MSIVVEELGHAVGEGHWLYRSLSGSFEAGSFTAVVGPNGAGKSTLLRDLVGLTMPTEGNVLHGHTPLAQMAARARAQCIAYLPQSTDLYYDLSVREVVTLGRAPHRGRFAPAGADDHESIERALDAVNITGLASRGVLTLSGGERQRTMLARMLATGTSTLVLDEPTSALDIGHALGFLELCRRLVAEGCAVVMAMHDLEQARRYADRVLCLTSSHEYSLGPTADVLSADLLARVFDVEVREQPEGMLFFPRGPERR